MGEGSGRGSGRVRLFVGNRVSGRVYVSLGRVGSGSRKVTRGQLWYSLHSLINNFVFFRLFQQFWVCPEVTCLPISHDCSLVEYLVYEFEYSTPSGSARTARCRSCQYCLDMPHGMMTSRQRRSISSDSVGGRGQQHQQQQCRRQ